MMITIMLIIMIIVMIKSHNRTAVLLWLLY